MKKLPELKPLEERHKAVTEGRDLLIAKLEELEEPYLVELLMSNDLKKSRKEYERRYQVWGSWTVHQRNDGAGDIEVFINEKTAWAFAKRGRAVADWIATLHGLYITGRGWKPNHFIPSDDEMVDYAQNRINYMCREE